MHTQCHTYMHSDIHACIQTYIHEPPYIHNQYIHPYTHTQTRARAHTHTHQSRCMPCGSVCAPIWHCLHEDAARRLMHTEPRARVYYWKLFLRTTTGHLLTPTDVLRCYSLVTLSPAAAAAASVLKISPHARVMDCLRRRACARRMGVYVACTWCSSISITQLH